MTKPTETRRADWHAPAIAQQIATIKANPDPAELTAAINQALAARQHWPRDQVRRDIISSGQNRYTVASGPGTAEGLTVHVYLN